MKSACFFLLSSAFLVSAWTGFVSRPCNRPNASIALTNPTEQTQHYQGTRRGIPGRREGGATR